MPCGTSTFHFHGILMTSIGRERQSIRKHLCLEFTGFGITCSRRHGMSCCAEECLQVHAFASERLLNSDYNDNNKLNCLNVNICKLSCLKKKSK